MAQVFSAESYEAGEQNLAAGHKCIFYFYCLTDPILFLHNAEQGAHSGTEQNLRGGLCETDGGPH